MGLLLCIIVATASSHAQQNQSQPPTEQVNDDVLRISTELVQTDVVVLDKQGKFVDGLNPQQFSLRVDGKSQPISFFERVTAGSLNEEAQLAATRRGTRASATRESITGPLRYGRTVIFFVDDLHMSFASLERGRKFLLHFIDSEIGENDLAIVASPSGSIGFLQQFTANKTVLRAAVHRIKYRPYYVRDSQNPPLTEFQAEAISRGERDAIDYFVDAVLRERGIPLRGQSRNAGREAAEMEVRDRARRILSQAASISTNTLASLDGLMHVAARLSGRKITFFLSDGFFLGDRDSEALDRLRRVTTSAARAGVVIYTMDARGLVTGAPDASQAVAMDPSGRLSRATMGEVSASQEPLFTIAADTGGRALINSNDYEPRIARALEETSRYYLLVWRPEAQINRGRKFHHIEVTVAGRPDLTVRARRGFVVEEAKSVAKDSSSNTHSSRAPKSSEDELREALRDSIPRKDMATSLSAKYLDLPGKGLLLNIMMQIPSEFLTFNQTSGKTIAMVEVAGAIFNDQGKQFSGFRENLKVSASLADQTSTLGHRLTYNSQQAIRPGLYQVRVASRDAQSSRVGSSMEWIEIPDLAAGKLALSSLFVGELKVEPADANRASDAPERLQLTVDQRFTNSSKLRFFTYLYNAARGSTGDSAPDVTFQVKVFRQGRAVIANQERKFSTEGIRDLSRLPYAAELSLTSLPAGPYMLEVTAVDRIAKTTASQHVDFEIH